MVGIVLALRSSTEEQGWLGGGGSPLRHKVLTSERWDTDESVHEEQLIAGALFAGLLRVLSEISTAQIGSGYRRKFGREDKA